MALFVIFLLISHKRKKVISNTLITCHPRKSKSLMINKLLFKKSETTKPHWYNTNTERAPAICSEAEATQVKVKRCLR